jgi:hypothetical protein
MDISRIFWEKATAAHVYCAKGGAGLSDRFSRHFHDIVRLEEARHLANALAARNIAEAVAIHKNAFFAEKDAAGNRIDYLADLRSGLTIVRLCFKRLKPLHSHWTLRRIRAWPFSKRTSMPFGILLANSIRLLLYRVYVLCPSTLCSQNRSGPLWNPVEDK